MFDGDSAVKESRRLKEEAKSLLKEHPGEAVLGCAKCRGSETGCSRCRFVLLLFELEAFFLLMLAGIWWLFHGVGLHWVYC